MDYIPQNYYRDAADSLANYRRLRQILDEICDINHELLLRREAL
jgi:hypothetical protein